MFPGFKRLIHTSSILSVLWLQFGCSDGYEEWIVPYSDESSEIYISNLYDHIEVKEKFLERFPLGTTKDKVLSVLDMAEDGKGILYLIEEEIITAEIPRTDYHFVQIFFYFKGDDLEEILTVGTNMSLRGFPQDREEN